MTDIFIIGCGQIGQLVAQKWGKDSRSIIALARSEASEARLQAQGLKTYRGDLDEPSTLHGLPVSGSLLYYFAPPTPSGVMDLRMQHFIAGLNASVAPRHIIYISTSGVYGDTKGEWVTEEHPTRPQADRAKRRLDAEQQLSRWCEASGTALTTLRVAGIYGPGKLPIKRLQMGTPVLREEECGFTNRIHIEDLVATCTAAARPGKGRAIYNVSDGQPDTLCHYFNSVADALQLPRPAQVTMEEARKQLAPAMISYLSESRRIDNGKLLRELGVTLKYPDLASGLKAIVTDQV